MSQIALVWVAAKVASPIVGANSIQRLQESVITQIELTPEETTYLEEPYEPKVVRGHLWISIAAFMKSYPPFIISIMYVLF